MYVQGKQLYELSRLRESGRFLTDKALWGVATDRCMKTTHNAFRETDQIPPPEQIRPPPRNKSPLFLQNYRSIVRLITYEKPLKPAKLRYTRFHYNFFVISKNIPHSKFIEYLIWKIDGWAFCPTPGNGVKKHCLKIDAPVLSTFSFKIRAFYQKIKF